MIDGIELAKRIKARVSAWYLGNKDNYSGCETCGYDNTKPSCEDVQDIIDHELEEMKKKKDIIDAVICQGCGDYLGKHRTEVSTFYKGICDYCGERKIVTQSRDYGYPPLPERRKRK